jgi:hypothetical protein
LVHTDFSLASGSVIGRDHRNINVHKNNQDGLAIVRNAQGTVAIVTDGCGSSPHSEVGALLGARLIAEAIRRETESCPADSINWIHVQQDVLRTYELLTAKMGGSFSTNVQQYFLFTVVGVLLADGWATFFALGDGVVVVNGQLMQIGPYPENQPPYLGYDLLDGSGMVISIVQRIRLSHLEHFLIGTDGVMDLVNSAGKNLPGMQEPVGELSQFWENPRYFNPEKPDLLNRRLRMIARDWPKRDPEPGLLSDDTTLIVGRSPLT